MVKRHLQPRDKEETKNQPTFSAPDSVDEPKTGKEKKTKEIEVEREILETNLEGDYLDKINKSKILSRDLAVVSNSKLYKDDPKPDRRYNKAVEHTNHELKLATFFLSNLKPHYRNKIKSSPEFNNLISNILDIKSAGLSNMTQNEKDQSLAISSQMLAYSLEVIIKLMPSEFRVPLVDTAKPFTNLIKALNEFARKNNLKGIPQINMPDTLSTR